MRSPWRNGSRPDRGFTLFETLIAMSLTAVIGAVMFQTWNMTAQSGAEAAKTIRERERERTAVSLMDNDFATMIFPGDENPNMPFPSPDPMEYAPEYYELLDKKKGDKKSDIKTLLSFAGETSLTKERPMPGAAVCVEYRLRGKAGKYALERRERAHCGVSGDFPWLETVLLDKLQDAKIELLLAGGSSASRWGEADLSPLPSAVRLSWKDEKSREREILFPILPRRIEVELEED